MLIHVIHHHVVRIASVVKLMDKVFVHACQHIPVLRPVADPNVRSALNVIWTGLVLTKNVLIHARMHAVNWPNVEQPIIVQYVSVQTA